MTKLGVISDWVRSNPIIVISGALTTLFGLIISVSSVIPIMLKAAGRPSCLTYANVYSDAWSDFKLEGAVWHEYPHEGGPFRYEFREVHRTPEYIELLNLTPRPDQPGWETLVVRLPVCGGTAQLTLGITQHWIDLYQVWRN